VLSQPVDCQINSSLKIGSNHPVVGSPAFRLGLTRRGPVIHAMQTVQSSKSCIQGGYSMSEEGISVKPPSCCHNDSI
jgi:hypothetical protein